MRLTNRVRLFFGLPFEREDHGDGLYLVDVPRQGAWDHRPKAAPRCQVCGGEPTHFKRLPPWPGTSYSHETFTCDAHKSYLDGHEWHRGSEGEWTDAGPAEGSCATCHAPYGSCAHSAHYAAMAQAQDEAAIRGRL